MLAGILFLLTFVFGILAVKEYIPFLNSSYHLKNLRQIAIREPNDTSDFIEDSALDLPQIDFVALQEMNEDIKGWIYCPQIGVNQPILKGSTDNEYLSKAYDKSYDCVGSIFTFSDAKDDLSDDNLFLFGHNMRSGQMFGNLDYFCDDTFLNDNKYVYIYTPTTISEYEVFDVFKIDKKDVFFSSKTSSFEDTKQLNLCTCNGYRGTPIRLVVRCRLNTYMNVPDSGTERSVNAGLK